MAALPKFLLGRHLTAITITPQTQADDGTLADTTPVQTVTGTCRSVELSIDNQLEDIRPVNTTLANNVVVATDSTITVRQLILKTYASTTQMAIAASTPALASIPQKVAFTRGGKSWSVVGNIQSYNEGVNSQGANEATMVIRLIDDGTGPAFS